MDKKAKGSASVAKAKGARVDHEVAKCSTSDLPVDLPVAVANEHKVMVPSKEAKDRGNFLSFAGCPRETFYFYRNRNKLGLSYTFQALLMSRWIE